MRALAAREGFARYHETAASLAELDQIINSDRYFLSPRIHTLKAIRAKIRPSPRKALPVPVANCPRMRSTTSVFTGRRPRRFPWLLARARPDLTRSMIIAHSNSAKTPKI